MNFQGQRFYERAIWILAMLLGCAVIAIVHCGCGGSAPDPKTPDVAACLEQGIGEMLTSKSCVDALQALQRVVRKSPECAVVLTPKGSELTAITLGAVTLICDGSWPPSEPIGDGGTDG